MGGVHDGNGEMQPKDPPPGRKETVGQKQSLEDALGGPIQRAKRSITSITIAITIKQMMATGPTGPSPMQNRWSYSYKTLCVFSPSRYLV
jgi:hypothetical protein